MSTFTTERLLALLLREPVAREWEGRERASIREFLDIWYSAETQTCLRDIVIRD